MQRSESTLSFSDRHHDKAYGEDKNEQGHRVHSGGRHGHEEGHDDVAKAKEHYEKGVHDSAHHERQHEDIEGSYGERRNYGTIPSPPVVPEDHVSGSNAPVTAVKPESVKQIPRIRVRQKNRDRTKEVPAVQASGITVGRRNSKKPSLYQESPPAASLGTVPVEGPGSSSRYLRPADGTSRGIRRPPGYNSRSGPRGSPANRNDLPLLNTVRTGDQNPSVYGTNLAQPPILREHQLLTDTRDQLLSAPEAAMNQMPNVRAGSYREEIPDGYRFHDNAPGPPQQQEEVSLQPSELQQFPHGNGQVPPVHSTLSPGTLAYPIEVVHDQPFANGQYGANVAKFGGTGDYHEIQHGPAIHLDANVARHQPVPYRQYVLRGPQERPLLSAEDLYRPSSNLHPKQLFHTFGGGGEDVVIPSTSTNSFDVRMIPRDTPAKKNISTSEGILPNASLSFGNKAGHSTGIGDCAYNNNSVGPEKVLCTGTRSSSKLRPSNDNQDTKSLHLTQSGTVRSVLAESQVGVASKDRGRHREEPTYQSAPDDGGIISPGSYPCLDDNCDNGNRYGKRKQPPRRYSNVGQIKNGVKKAKGNRLLSSYVNSAEANDTVGYKTSSGKVPDPTLGRDGAPVPLEEEFEMAKPVMESMGYIVDLPDSPIPTTVPEGSEVKVPSAADDYSQPVALGSRQGVQEDGRWYARAEPG